MRGLITQSLIWKIVGCVSAISGLVCFALGSTYKKSFGKLGFGGLLFYLFVGLIIWYLIVRAKRIQVSEKLQGVVAALIFVVICLISIVHDKLVSGKSDAMSIISYGSFALMSLSMSRKFELGFETGFSTFFLSMFAAQVFKIKWFLLPIALVFCSVLIIIRHYSECEGQSGSISPNGYHPIEVGLPNAAVIDIGDEDIIESQGSQETEEVSGQSLLSRNIQQNNQVESSQAMHHSPSNGQVSEGRILDWDNEQNSEQEEDRRWYLAPESSAQYHVSIQDNTLRIQNRRVHTYAEPEIILLAPPREIIRRRRVRWMIPTIPDISRSVAGKLRQVAPLFLFFLLLQLITIALKEEA